MFNKILPHLISCILFVVISMAYFFPLLQGKVMPMGDIVQHGAMAKEIRDYNKTSDDVALWTNSMFGGMPAYQISVRHEANKLPIIKKIMGLGFARPISMFLIGCFSFYIMLLLLGVNSWLALIGALFFVFSTNNLVLIEAGHMSKVNTIMISPLIISGMLIIFKQRWLIGLSVFTLGMGLNLSSNHVQMTYYLGLVLAILVIIYGIKAIQDKDLLVFGKSLGVLLIGTLLALGSSTSLLWTTYEYGKDTMRGEPILKTEQAVDVNSSSEVDGLAWNYAMNWSNGGIDLLSSFIPRVVGGGSVESVDKSSAFAKVARVTKDPRAPLYWGGLPSTSGPVYFGALVFFLFIFGAISYKSPVKWWLIVGVLFTFMLSLGKNMEFFNKLFFDYLPFFNKFRTPNSVLSITVILMPILGVLGLNEMIKSDDKKAYWKPALWSAMAVGGVALLIGLLGSSIFDMSSPGDARYQQNPALVDALLEDRASYLRSSALRTVFIVLIGLGLIWAYLNQKMSAFVMIVLIGLIGLFDLIQVDKRYVNSSDFITKSRYKSNYSPRPVDTKILEDSDLHYRVHDVTSDPWNSAMSAYYHKLIGGYHPAKLQRYQDVIERHISKNNMVALNMLNAKYFITPNRQDQNGGATYQLNPAAMGNAWFVKNIDIVQSSNEEIDRINGLEPAITAVVHKEFESKLTGKSFDKTGSIVLNSYSPNKLSYTSNSQSPQFAVFSEVWYGPNKGWTATIDGQEVDLLRANYVLRAINLPAGQHEIIFEFKPQSFATGSTISLICSILILLLLIVAIFFLYKDSNSGVEEV